MFINNNIKGAIYLVIACIIACLDNVFIHYVGLSGAHIPAAQIFFLKMFSALIFITITIAQKDCRLFKTQCLLLQVTRSILGAAGNYIWVLALTILPLSFAVSLSMASIFFNSLGSVLFFNEKLQLKRVLCTCLGFLGITYFAQQEKVVLGAAVLLPLISAFFLSAASLLIKPITKKDSLLTTMFYLMLTMTLIGLPGAWKTWKVLSMPQTLSLMCLGITYITTMAFLIYAYKIAEVTYISPFKFSKLPLNLSFGFFIFHEHLSTPSLVCLVLIIFSAALLTLFELENTSKSLKKQL